ncbi:hypothetical protein GCM10023317_45260 [Actinopolymorpha pittospori]
MWIWNWQIQCCGTPFTVGSEVTWTVTEPDAESLSPILGETRAAGVTYEEEHHGSEAAVIGSVHGTVRSIQAVHCQLASVPNTDPQILAAVPGSAVSVHVTHADGWDTGGTIEDFCGYVVDLEQLDFRPVESG